MMRERVEVLGRKIDHISWEAIVKTLTHWAIERESRFLCCCNVHSLITADGDAQMDDALRRADLVVPDGAPVAWMMRRLGAAGQQRVGGPDLMWYTLNEANRLRLPIFLYGSTDATLQLLSRRIAIAFPGIQIAGAISPPFRCLSSSEEMDIVRTINQSGARLLWVGLGCPKQEIWMSRNREKIEMPMIGVGAAFDYHAGVLARAPHWLRAAGLEWLYRLLQEPRRLWRRYLVTNTLFLIRASVQLAKRR